MTDVSFTLEELELIQNNLSWEDCYNKNLKLMEINNKLTEMISTATKTKEKNND